MIKDFKNKSPNTSRAKRALIILSAITGQMFFEIGLECYYQF